MKKLIHQAEEAGLMNIRITHDEVGKLRFNLFEELVINEGKINSEIVEQPSIFAYLGLLHKKLERIVRDKQMQADKVFATSYLTAKEELNHKTGRIVDKETANQRAISSLAYQTIMKELSKATEDRDIIAVCLKSFEQRANMIQTLSANVRRISN